ncbi:MAG: hypothetical protein WA134_03180 [Rhodoferax sp.]
MKHDSWPLIFKTNREMGMEKHNSPLNCTFLHCSSKNSACKLFVKNFYNEIKDLEAI